MKEQLISLKTAKLAKEKGFNEPCLVNVWKDNNDYYYIHLAIPQCNDDYLTIRCSAPIQSVLQQWLREIHFIHVEICRDEDEWKPTLYNFKNGNKHISNGVTTYKEYTEALEAGLYFALNQLI